MKRAIIVVSVACLAVALLYAVWVGYLFLDGGMSSGMLHHHVARGEADQVHKILRWDPSLTEEIDAPFSQRRALHIACEHKQLAVAEVLLRHGADVKARDSWGRTPLHEAAEQGHLPMVQLLLASGAEVDATDEGGGTPLHEAAGGGHLTTVSALLAAGARLDLPHGRSERTPMQFAAGWGRLPVVKLLVERGASLSNKAWDGRTALRNAAEDGHLETALYLRGKGAPLDFVSAAGIGDTAFVRECLRHPKAAPSSADKDAALYVACKNGQPAAVEELLAAGVSLEGSDRWAGSPLHTAVRSNKEAVARLLLLRGADANATNQSGETPLFAAVGDRRHHLVRLLLANKANVNHQDKYGGTVLHLASAPIEEDLPLLETLLKAGADPNARDRDGGTPLRRAINRTEIENLLRRHGAK